MRKSVWILVVLFLSCSGIHTSDPEEAFSQWSRSEVPHDVKVLKGTYWQSAHFTREYEVYLQLQTTADWWERFVADNDLILSAEAWEKPKACPAWFEPDENCVVYGSKGGSADDSRYFRDTVNNVCYLYEISL